ncbi:hypothetical protein CR513_09918, partial [Mucuna pruriens]
MSPLEKLAPQEEDIQGKRRSRTERPNVVKGDRLACHHTLVDLILSALANKGEPLPLHHGDRRGRRIHRIHALCFYFSWTENNDRTLKELATPDVVYQPWCIQYPQLELAQTYKLKSGLIHLLPKFHGLIGDPHKHLKEFHVVCSIMRS